MTTNWASTGMDGLDHIIDGLRIGDNVVWQIDSVKDYQQFVLPYVKRALKDNKRIVYVRFAQHKPLLEPDPRIKIHKLNASGGFESFATQVHQILTSEGEDVYYVFDCLSHLLMIWATDVMIDNLFSTTCPKLYQLKTIAYFGILRNRHSFKTIASIRSTTQLLLDVYNFRGSLYLQPLKVWKRKSPTMFLPHIKADDSFEPLTSSLEATKLMSNVRKRRNEGSTRHLDYWDRLFLKAENLATKDGSCEEKMETIRQLCRVLISRESDMLKLARKYFSLEQLLQLKERMVGTGFIGGKAVGMLLARAILEEDNNLDWSQVMEEHDSFYIGSDVFYTYLVQNGCWDLRMEQKSDSGYYKVAEKLQREILQGTFDRDIKEQFHQMLEYFGQYPFIVRSSSLLEDSFGNAFAGKYESVFCVNQGSPEKRYRQLEEAIRTVYASMLSRDALVYRKQRGLHKKEEQMALLVQRVSGAYRGHYFFPYMAGVGNSFNTFVWNKELDPKAGMLRLVFGLGTRAVDRAETDYPRLVALDKPLLRPLAGIEDKRRFSQNRVDLLNIEKNKLETVSLKELSNEGLDLNIERIAERDRELIQRLRELGKENGDAWILTFDKLFAESDFAHMMGQMLTTLEKGYNYPVDVEFTVNFDADESPCVNLLQCRPLQTKEHGKKVEMPADIKSLKTIMNFEGSFMGGSADMSIKRLIYIDPEEYVQLSQSDKYKVARAIGKLNREIKNRTEDTTMLLGPGRWGTTTPSLGVPVSFAEISNISVLGEIAYKIGGMSPELSYGSHFFQDLVEANIFYIAIFPNRKEVQFDKRWIDELPYCLASAQKIEPKIRRALKVCDLRGSKVKLLADVVTQKLLCYSDDS